MGHLYPSDMAVLFFCVDQLLRNSDPHTVCSIELHSYATVSHYLVHNLVHAMPLYLSELSSRHTVQEDSQGEFPYPTDPK